MPLENEVKHLSLTLDKKTYKKHIIKKQSYNSNLVAARKKLLITNR